MSAKSLGPQATWFDSDDAPEITDEFFTQATPMVGGKAVAFTQFAAQARKRMRCPPVQMVQVVCPTLTLRVDPEVLDALKSSGKG